MTSKFTIPSIADPEFEFVILHPSYFLPGHAVLAVFDRDSTTASHKEYVVAEDHCLRETHNARSPRLPPFRPNFSNRLPVHCLNIFLVILNAETKFRRYDRLHSLADDLPSDVRGLMARTQALVDLLYWTPIPSYGSQGEQLRSELGSSQRRNVPRSARPKATLVESGSLSDSEAEMEPTSESQMEDESGDSIPETSRIKWDQARIDWLVNSDAETSKVWLTALMSGYGIVTFLCYVKHDTDLVSHR